MSFSKEFRYRNLGMRREYRGRTGGVPGIIIVGVAAVLVLCCACLGLVIGFQARGAPLPKLPGFSNPLASAPKPTATPNLNAEVPIKSKGLNENGLEMTVLSFQRPLQVRGLAQLPPDQQFVLVSVLLRNSGKSTGQAVKISPADFKLKGDGGLTYEANPKTVTIDNLLTAQDSLAVNKDVERELIFQVAKDDSGLKLYWTVGKTTRVFVLEPEK